MYAVMAGSTEEPAKVEKVEGIKTEGTVGGAAAPTQQLAQWLHLPCGAFKWSAPTCAQCSSCAATAASPL